MRRRVVHWHTVRTRELCISLPLVVALMMCTLSGCTVERLHWRFHTSGLVLSSPTVAKDIVYVGSADSWVYALRATNGTLVWRYQTGDAVNSSPTVAQDMVYVGSNDTSVYALHA